MSAHNETLLGRVTLAAKLITQEQLADALRFQSSLPENKSLGQVLMDLGYLSEDGLKRALALQRSVLERARQSRPAADGREQQSPAKARSKARPAPPARTEVQARPAPTARTEAQAKPAPPARTEAQAKPAPPRAAPQQISRQTERAAAIPASGAPAVELGQESDAAATDALARQATGMPTGPIASGSSAKIDAILRRAVDVSASDVHVHSGSKLRFRIAGHLQEQGDAVLDPEEAGEMALSLLGEAERALFDERGEMDFAYTIDGVSRFRANVYRQLRGIDASLRRIPLTPPSLEELGVPTALAKLTCFHQGMVLVTGPTRCGKSTTMAALVELVNSERAEHILSIEDPIEYLHPSKRCLVNQRNVGPHTESFSRALRAALREDPDVIVIGELRDRETISLAMTAAETGHFVLATLHTDNAIRTVNRIIGAFPPDQQDQVRSMLSESLRAVISQRLLPRADGAGEVAAVETMLVNRAVGNLIRENKTVQLRSILQTGKNQGMRLLDDALAELVQNGVVSRESALRCAEDPKLIPG